MMRALVLLVLYMYYVYINQHTKFHYTEHFHIPRLPLLRYCAMEERGLLLYYYNLT